MSTPPGTKLQTIKLPKIIHTIWFGEIKLPSKNTKNILHWLAANPDFTVILWVDRRGTDKKIIDNYPRQFIDAAITLMSENSPAPISHEGCSRPAITTLQASSASAISSSACDSASTSSSMKKIQLSLAITNDANSEGAGISFTDEPQSVVNYDDLLQLLKSNLCIYDINDDLIFQRGLDETHLKLVEQKDSVPYSRLIDSIGHKTCKPRSNPANASDEARIAVLYGHGGIYLDCGDVFPGNLPLARCEPFATPPTEHRFCFHQEVNSIVNDIIISTKGNPIAQKILVSFLQQNYCSLPKTIAPLELYDLEQTLARLFLGCFDPWLNQQSTVNTTGPKALIAALESEAKTNTIIGTDFYKLQKEQDLSWVVFEFICSNLKQTTTNTKIAEIIQIAIPLLQFEIAHGYFRLDTYIYWILKSAYGLASIPPVQKNTLHNQVEKQLLEQLTNAKTDFTKVQALHLFSTEINRSGIIFCQQKMPIAYCLAFPTAKTLHEQPHDAIYSQMLLKIAMPVESIENCFKVPTDIAYHDEAQKNGLLLIDISIDYLRLLIDHIKQEALKVVTVDQVEDLQKYNTLIIKRCAELSEVIAKYLAPAQQIEKITAIHDLLEQLPWLSKTKSSRLYRKEVRPIVPRELTKTKYASSEQLTDIILQYSLDYDIKATYLDSIEELLAEAKATSSTMKQ